MPLWAQQEYGQAWQQNITQASGNWSNGSHADSDSAEMPTATKERLQKQFRKTQWCKFIAQESGCNLGAECKFAHSPEELNAVPDLTKTSLCLAFGRGSCDKGASCKFAHGQKELRITAAFREKQAAAALLANCGSSSSGGSAGRGQASQQAWATADANEALSNQHYQQWKSQWETSHAQGLSDWQQWAGH